MMVAKEINKSLEPFREKRAALEAKPEYVRAVLAEGASRARAIARETLKEAKARVNIV
jgi:tryptophanyl-tRNA synthetase